LHLWRGGQRGLRSAGFSTGPHWHVHITPPDRSDVYLLPVGTVEQLKAYAV
jgi:diadenosine tetraphosphate (Ap4A) HIT family hydrolase